MKKGKQRISEGLCTNPPLRLIPPVYSGLQQPAGKKWMKDHQLFLLAGTLVSVILTVYSLLPPCNCSPGVVPELSGPHSAC